jgi:hypothetical protein
MSLHPHVTTTHDIGPTADVAVALARSHTVGFPSFVPYGGLSFAFSNLAPLRPELRSTLFLTYFCGKRVFRSIVFA